MQLIKKYFYLYQNQMRAKKRQFLHCSLTSVIINRES